MRRACSCRTRFVFTATLAAIVVAGQSSEAAELKLTEESLHGEWDCRLVVAEAAMKSEPMFADYPEEALAETAKEIQKQFNMNRVKATVQAKGAWITESEGPGIDPKHKKSTVTWSVVKIKGNTIEVKMVDDKDKSTQQATLQFADQKTFVMQSDDCKWVFVEFRKR
jgi:hypothetical protein